MAEVPSQSAIWQVLDHLRDELHAHNKAVTLAGLIYLRWADFQDAEQEAIAAFDGIDYKPVLPAFLHWRSWHTLPPREMQELFADRLPQALEWSNNSRHNSLATHLHHVAPAIKDLGRISPQPRDALIRWLADQPFETPSDCRALLDIFDSVLEKEFDKYSGQFRTPASVCQLLVELAAPATGDRIYDPCFGSAGLLTTAYDYVLRHEKEHFSRSGAPLLAVSGVERNSSAYVVGLTRLALAGLGDPQLELGNSLERMPSNNPQRDGFDVVLCNPPWGMRVDLAGLDYYPVRTTDATALFIQHTLSQLRPEGRAVIVVPQGFLFRGGPEQHLRRLLLEEHTVEAVVALPESAFMPYTAVRGNILVLRRGGPTTRIRMADAEPFFEKGKGRQPATIRSDKAEELGQKLRAPEPSEHCWDVDAESLAKVDWDFSPRRRDQSGLFGILDSLRAELNVVPLKECCQILIGRAFKSEQLLDSPPPRPLAPEQASLFLEDRRGIKQASLFDLPYIPYVRIKDIKRGQVDQGSSWLSPDAALSVDARWKLRAGDVLLSKSGTIGKAGIVRNGAVGAIAASGLFVLRPDHDRLDPHFFLAYLASSECRAWLGDKARGAMIRHLSRQVVDELPVPLPALQMQQRVAGEHREHDVDALAFLSQLLIGGVKEPVSEWIEKIVEILPASADAIGDPLDLSTLDRVATEVQRVRNEAAHGRHGDSPLAAWILQFNEAVSGLRGVGAIPRGPGLLSVLQESARGLKDALQTIKGYLPNEAKARDLTKLIASWLDMACSVLLDDVKLVLSTDAASLRAGEMADISLQVHNQGPLPLRDLRITTTPDWGSGKFGYVAENAKVSIHLSGASPKMSGTFSLTASWSGSKLDGQPVKGDREIALSVLEQSVQGDADQVDLGGSPYICGDPVRPERNDVFFGREELLDQIRRQVIQSGNVVLLEGNRRSGKSSILWHLEGPNAVPGWMGIYCSFQGAQGSRDGAGVPTVEVFRELAISIATSLHALGGVTPLPDGTVLQPGRKLGIARACQVGISEASSFSDFRNYAEAALERLAERNLGLLLMLDEFDKLQEGIDSGVTSSQVPENIRFLVQSYPRFSAILTGSRRLKRLREEYWSSLFGLGTRFGVTTLSVEAARRLVTEPVKGRLTYSQEAVERAISVTARQPFLLQCLCNRIFDRAAQLKTRTVTLDFVEKAGEVLVENNEHFASMWDYARSDQRRFILALCHKEAESPDPFRLGVIKEKLVSHGIELDDETLVADLEFLRDLELVELVGESSGGHYVLAIPLMGAWIERHQDFAAIKCRARAEREGQDG